MIKYFCDVCNRALDQVGIKVTNNDLIIQIDTPKEQCSQHIMQLKVTIEPEKHICRKCYYSTLKAEYEKYIAKDYK